MARRPVALAAVVAWALVACCARGAAAAEGGGESGGAHGAAAHAAQLDVCRDASYANRINNPGESARPRVALCANFRWLRVQPARARGSDCDRRCTAQPSIHTPHPTAHPPHPPPPRRPPPPPPPPPPPHPNPRANRRQPRTTGASCPRRLTTWSCLGGWRWCWPACCRASWPRCSCCWRVRGGRALVRGRGVALAFAAPPNPSAPCVSKRPLGHMPSFAPPAGPTPRTKPIPAPPEPNHHR